MNQLSKLEKAIRDLYLSVAKLHEAFLERPFTPDGRMVGDIGEAIAALKFNIILDQKIKKHWDDCWVDSSGKKHDIQIKATQNDDTYLKKPPHDGTFLVFKIFRNGKHKVIYNGSVMKVWKSINQNTKEKMINLKKLEELNLNSDSEKVNL